MWKEDEPIATIARHSSNDSGHKNNLYLANVNYVFTNNCCHGVSLVVTESLIVYCDVRAYCSKHIIVPLVSVICKQSPWWQRCIYYFTQYLTCLYWLNYYISASSNLWTLFTNKQPHSNIFRLLIKQFLSFNWNWKQYFPEAYL